MNKRRYLIIVFAFLSLLVITMALSGYPSGGVTSSQARGEGGSGIFSLLAETPLPDFLNAFLPLVMYSWPSPTPTPTATATMTPTPTPTITPTKQVLPYTQCRNADLTILDNGSAYDGMTVTKSGTIQSMRVYLDVSHTFVNDLVFTLEQENTSKKITLINRPRTLGGDVCTGNNIDAYLADNASIPVDSSCINNAVPAISGEKRPYMLLLVYNSEQMAGQWELVVKDTRPGDSGRLNVWCLEFRYID